MAKSITKINPTINMYSAVPLNGTNKKRVAGYARVSTDSDEQYTSYEAQVDYYTRFIKAQPLWEFVKVYADEGISGTNTKHRDGFNAMINDALAGKIDLIITKSISRFARNTVDTLTTIRKLKEHGCECFFEKENIYTFDGKGELILTIMSSLAQEESRSISENVTWGQRKRFADGKVTMPYKHFLGYERGPDGTPSIEPQQAEVVRLIFRLFLDGLTPNRICIELEKQGILSPANKNKWNPSTVLSILQNERYKGDALLQKSFTVDFLSKKIKRNNGEVPQYYVTNSHPAIIAPDEFDLVQAEIKRRKEQGHSYSGRDEFASKIVCGDCGSFYGKKVWHSTDSYKKYILRCNHRFDGVKCHSPILTQERIKQAFITAVNQLIENKVQIINDCESIRRLLLEHDVIHKQIEQCNEEMAALVELNKTLIYNNAQNPIEKGEYKKRLRQYNEQYENAKNEMDRLTEEENTRNQRDLRLRSFIKALSGRSELLEDWDEQLWNQMVQKVVAFRDGHLEFYFKNDQVIPVEL